MSETATFLGVKLINAAAFEVNTADIAFDATISESAKYSAVLTKNPIESGAEVNDHFYLAPRTLALEVGVTNTPMNENTNDIINQASQLIGTASSASAERRKSALELLKAIQAGGEPFDVQTGLDLHKNMLILDIATVNNAELSGALVAIVTLQEALFTETSVGLLPREILPTEMKPKAEVKKKGKTQEATGSEFKSNAAALADKIFG